ncbi:MAG: UDP-N-acetylglucosamine 2-epimerase (non-hydrolyzing) [Bacteroidetes bacterium]|nr:UDP-N-acetylglucosamine 2-epimerase (non-hydrolyzing) [Bacteroidota bacterium]
MKKILIVAGTRPNFVKITRFKKITLKYPLLEFKIAHTGQHYDDRLSDIFFRQFDLVPDFFLNISSRSPASQVAEIMMRLEKVADRYKPDLIMVPGDVNSTLAAALTANKMNIKLAHIESGLRSFDTSMPEEFNRIITDRLSDYLFVTEQSGIDHLLREGKQRENIYFTGNTMIDTLIAFRKQIDRSDVLKKLNTGKEKYLLMTMHRPSNVDSRKGLRKLVRIITRITGGYKVVFPAHPRTVKNLKQYRLFGTLLANKNLILSGPMDYFSFQKLVSGSFAVITDSGGIQEETTFLGIPCLTLRENTERPVTVSMGTNELIQFDEDIICRKISSIEKGLYKKGKIPPLWDGKATERIMKVLHNKRDLMDC